MSSTPLIGNLTDSLDTGQTEDDGFNSKPIDPELDDSEQLTGESIQPYLSLVGQLQWLVTLGRLDRLFYLSFNFECSSLHLTITRSNWYFG